MKVFKGIIGGLFLSLLNAVFIIIVYLLVLGFLGYNLFILGTIGILFTPILFYRGYKLGYNFEFSNVKIPKLFKLFNFPRKFGIKEIAYLLIILVAITYLADRYTKPVMNFGAGIIDFVVPDCYGSKYGCETNAEREARYDRQEAERQKHIEENKEWYDMLWKLEQKNKEFNEKLNALDDRQEKLEFIEEWKNSQLEPE